MYRLIVRISLVTLMALNLSACGDEAIGEGSQFEVTTSALYQDTSIIYFTLLGDALRYEGIGGFGTISGDYMEMTKRGQIAIPQVPEGRVRVYARGLNQVTTTTPDHPDFPDSYYQLIEHGHTTRWDPDLGLVDDWVNVIAQQRISTRVLTTIRNFYTIHTNIHVGAESLLIRGDYDFVSNDPNAGASDDFNRTKGVIAFLDGSLSAACDLSITYVDPEERGQESPVGLFPDLPTTWDDPKIDPWDSSITINMAIGESQAVFYIVAKPGTAGRDVQLEVDRDGTCSAWPAANSGPIYVRIVGYGSLDGEASLF